MSSNLTICQKNRNVLLVRVELERNTTRAEARVSIRAHLCDALVNWLGVGSETITFINLPGQAPRIMIDDLPEPGLSISHEAGLSLAAVNLQGPVGVDLVYVQEIPDWHLVARDYLGPTTASRLLATPAALRPFAFANAWCQHEALSKLNGQPLSEWKEHLDLAGNISRIDLPMPWLGVLALPR
ncbi:4'-phosphopantetheinyl transferase family protein [Pseudomonas viridiflava]|uniref:4'-phosphopantetheinyl transferase family protein n=1 Tax=Pseudomonas viridiflava TaxID=33069 RepID=UPI000F03894E|nr:phosphopantetheinyl transferase [Pseudomonas viridiflava]MEE4179771.1 phosphopantetheinyl transferase [Pseudomonas viridiflava]